MFYTKIIISLNQATTPSISCFGKIAGITQVGYDFYINIGTNSIINILLQGTFWTLLMSFLTKEKKVLYKEI